MSVGTVKTAWIKEGCELYQDRLRRACDFSERVIKSGAAAEEHERILQALSKVQGAIVILDETGKEHSSRGFAGWLGKTRDAGMPVTFVLGGAYGFSDEIRQKGSLVLRLSSMTFPHELCKLVFLEQLYRAYEILKGSGYHH